MAFAQRTAAPPEHSVEITRNAKGHVQIGVTVRGYDIDAVLAQAQDAFGELDRNLPYPEEDQS